MFRICLWETLNSAQHRAPTYWQTETSAPIMWDIISSSGYCVGEKKSKLASCIFMESKLINSSWNEIISWPILLEEVWGLYILRDNLLLGDWTVYYKTSANDYTDACCFAPTVHWTLWPFAGLRSQKLPLPNYFLPWCWRTTTFIWRLLRTTIWQVDKIWIPFLVWPSLLKNR